MVVDIYYLRHRTSFLQVLSVLSCICYTNVRMKLPSLKRRQPWIRAAVYSTMTLSVVVIVALLMLIVLGYSFNERDGKLEQGGLLQFSTIPSGAKVTLNGLLLGSRTTTKTTVETGDHKVRYDLNGYRPWTKSIHISAGQIGWLNYARLIPTKITPEPVRTFEAIAGSQASPKHNWILIHEAADKPQFELANIQGDTVKYTTLTLPEAIYTQPADGKPQSFAIDSWSYDENAVLIRHVYNDNQTEWLLLNREQPEKSINLSTTFAITPAKIVFAGEGSRLLFVQADDIVRRINLDDQTLSRPLATKITSFAMYDEKTIMYVTAANDGAKRTVGYAATDIDQPVTLHTYPAETQPLLAAMETYFNKRYVSIVSGKKLTIDSGSLPTPGNKGEQKPYATITLPNDAADLQMSRNGRFVVAQLPDGYVTYDLELKKTSTTTWAYQSAAVRPIQWLDDYTIVNDNGGYARVYDFDGANQQSVMQVIEGNALTVSTNDKYLYGITQGANGMSLTRAKLIIN